MTSALTDWVRALCGAAVICAAAMALCPDGRVKRVLRLVCGLVMACALLSPVLELDFDAYSSALSGYGEAARAASPVTARPPARPRRERRRRRAYPAAAS